MNFNLIHKFANQFLKLTIYKFASNKIIIPKNTLLYHGAPSKFVPTIEESGSLRSVWTKDDQSGKRGSGDIIEEGLIWVTPDINRALAYAKGTQEDLEAGKVFATKASKDLVLVYLKEKIDAQEAEVLAKINKRQHYDPIKEGTTLGSALGKINMWGEDNLMPLKDMLSLLDIDGIMNNEIQYAIIADELTISHFFDMDELWSDYEERKAIDDQKAKEDSRRKKEIQQRQEDVLQQNRNAMTPEEKIIFDNTVDEILDVF